MSGHTLPRLAKPAALTTGLTACTVTLSAPVRRVPGLARPQAAIITAYLPKCG
jgi:hypothetical protein